MATENHRYTVSVDDELFGQIEKFRYEKRFSTRSQATVALIRMGMESYIKQMAPEKDPQD